RRPVIGFVRDRSRSDSRRLISKSRPLLPGANLGKADSSSAILNGPKITQLLELERPLPAGRATSRNAACPHTPALRSLRARSDTRHCGLSPISSAWRCHCKWRSCFLPRGGRPQIEPHVAVLRSVRCAWSTRHVLPSTRRRNWLSPRPGRNRLFSFLPQGSEPRHL